MNLFKNGQNLFFLMHPVKYIHATSFFKGSATSNKYSVYSDTVLKIHFKLKHFYCSL